MVNFKRVQSTLIR